jgi:hypothetical protein
MKKARSSISKARSYAEIGEFWDEHDLSDHWDKTRNVKFTWFSNRKRRTTPSQKDLSAKIQSVARKQGIPSDTLVNRWLGQKLKETRKRARKLSAKSA